MSMCGYYGEGCGGTRTNPSQGSQGWMDSLTPKEREEYIKKSNARWKGTIFDPKPQQDRRPSSKYGKLPEALPWIIGGAVILVLIYKFK